MLKTEGLKENGTKVHKGTFCLKEGKLKRTLNNRDMCNSLRPNQGVDPSPRFLAILLISNIPKETRK